MRKLTKREFIKIGAMGVSGVVFMPGFLGGCRTMPKVTVPSWVWYSGGRDEKKIKKDLRFLKRSGFTGIHFQGGLEQVKTASSLAHDLGLEFHVWVISLMARSAKIVKEHHDWYMISREGISIADHPPYVGYYKWLCPNKTEVVDYMVKRVEGLASMDHVDGVHLDYIRYPDVILPVGLWKKYHLVQDREYPQYDYCYCDDCRRKFKEQEGVDPLELPDPPKDKAWRQFRYDSVTRLVNRLKKMTEKYGKKLTAAVFPTPDIARKLVRQDWTCWNLDAVFPMIYHNFYEKDIDWIEVATREGIEALHGRYPLYSGLFVPAIAPDKIQQAVDFAMKGGAKGVCLFNFRGMTEKHWRDFLD